MKKTKIECCEKEEGCRAITFNEQNLILKNINDEKYLRFFYFCACTGLRVYEALSIKIKDIDMPKKMIKIKLRDTKTKKHKRDIPFLPELLKGFELKGVYLFEDITEDGSKQYFYKLYKDLGLDLCRHSTRHTFVSVCSYLEIPPEKIQMLVGHTDIKMTTDTYTHKLRKGTSPILKYLRKLKRERRL